MNTQTDIIQHWLNNTYPRIQWRNIYDRLIFAQGATRIVMRIDEDKIIMGQIDRIMNWNKEYWIIEWESSLSHKELHHNIHIKWYQEYDIDDPNFFYDLEKDINNAIPWYKKIQNSTMRRKRKCAR